MGNKISLLEPKSLTEAMEFSKTLSQSGLVPDAYRGKPANVLVAIQWGYEIGLPPMQALTNINVINGRPSLWGDGLIAVVKMHPNYYGMKEWLEGDTAYCSVKRKVHDTVEETIREFSIEDAKRSGLLNRPTWKSYPKRMLQMRARGFAIRDAFPDAIKGMITTEEAQDFPETVKVADINHVQPLKIESEGNMAENIVEALTEPSMGEQTQKDPIELKIMEKPSEQFENIDEWVSRYETIMEALNISKKFQPETKRTLLKEFEHINLEVLNRQVDPQAQVTLKQRRLDLNKILSIQAKEGVTNE